MQQVPVAPTEVLLVSFDLTHGEDYKICLVGKKAGDKGAITIVNAFEGQKAVDIFRLLTIANPEKKTWIEDHTEYICPHCGARFSDEIPYMCKGSASTNIFHMPRYCPDCGEPISEQTEGKKEE